MNEVVTHWLSCRWCSIFGVNKLVCMQNCLLPPSSVWTKSSGNEIVALILCAFCCSTLGNVNPENGIVISRTKIQVKDVIPKQKNTIFHKLDVLFRNAFKVEYLVRYLASIGKVHFYHFYKFVFSLPENWLSKRQISKKNILSSIAVFISICSWTDLLYYISNKKRTDWKIAKNVS